MSHALATVTEAIKQFEDKSGEKPGGIYAGVEAVERLKNDVAELNGGVYDNSFTRKDGAVMVINDVPIYEHWQLSPLDICLVCKSLKDHYIASVIAADHAASSKSVH